MHVYTSIYMRFYICSNDFSISTYAPFYICVGMWKSITRVVIWSNAGNVIMECLWDSSEYFYCGFTKNFLITFNLISVC